MINGYGRMPNMNYSNFGSRISRPYGPSKNSPQAKSPVPRKPAKTTRRRVLAAGASLVVGMLTMTSEAQPIEQSLPMFTTSQPPHHASKLAIVLLAGGLGVALFQSRLRLRFDLSC
jgi:hypothetical protein